MSTLITDNNFNPYFQPIVRKTVVRPAASPSKSSSSTSSPAQQSHSRHTPSRTPSQAMSKVQSASAATPKAPSTARPSAKQGPKSAIARDDLEECKYCGRRFAGDRLQVHEDICSKTGKKKRKTYDATKHRVQGTELEQYVRKGKGTVSSKVRIR